MTVKETPFYRNLLSLSLYQRELALLEYKADGDNYLYVEMCEELGCDNPYKLAYLIGDD